MNNYRNKFMEAVKHFWKTREMQGKKQGSDSGIKDYGQRRLVTGGKQLDGFIDIFRNIFLQNGVPEDSIYLRGTILPGYFRPTKEWDLLVVLNDQLIASIELKSHIGPSFGNNFNNRVEEALGSATDLWTAYREGAFEPSNKPWLGYFLLLEKHEKSLKPVKNREPHFSVFPEFVGASYQTRYELFCKKLVRERLYDAACLMISDKENGLNGEYEEPCSEVNVINFVSSLEAKAIESSRKIMALDDYLSTSIQ